MLYSSAHWNARAFMAEQGWQLQVAYYEVEQTVNASIHLPRKHVPSRSAHTLTSLPASTPASTLVWRRQHNTRVREIHSLPEKMVATMQMQCSLTIPQMTCRMLLFFLKKRTLLSSAPDPPEEKKVDHAFGMCFRIGFLMRCCRTQGHLVQTHELRAALPSRTTARL